MAAAAVFKGWEGGVCTHPHFISNTNPKKFDFLISKQYQIWSQNPGNLKTLRFDKFFGCFLAEKGQKWPKCYGHRHASVGVQKCAGVLHTLMSIQPSGTVTAAAAAAAPAQQRR